MKEIFVALCFLLINVSYAEAQSYEKFIGSWSEAYLVTSQEITEFDSLYFSDQWIYTFYSDQTYIQNEELICHGENYFPSGELKFGKNYLELVPSNTFCPNDLNDPVNRYSNIKWVNRNLWYTFEKGESAGQFVYHVYRRMKIIQAKT